MTGIRVPVLLVLVAACGKPPVAATDEQVYRELLSCGAMGYYDGGAAEWQESEDALAQARKIGDKPWLDCVYAGALPSACGAPCLR